MTGPTRSTRHPDEDVVEPRLRLAGGEARTRTWVLLLAGPLIWFGHFMVVYLLAEAACTFDLLADEVLGLTVLAVAIVAVTVAAAVIVAVVAALSARRYRRLSRASAEGRPGAPSGSPAQGGSTAEAAVRESDRSLAFIGAFLGAVSVVAILAVGLPALVLAPC